MCRHDAGGADEVCTAMIVLALRAAHASIAEPPVQSFDKLPEDLILQVVKSTDTSSLCDLMAVGKAWCPRARQELHTRLARAFKLSTLASELQGQGRYHEAEQLCREAVELLRKKLGDRHPSTLTFIHNLGVLLKDQDDPWSAEPLLREAMRGQREVLGDRHRSTLASRCSLGALLREKGEAELDAKTLSQIAVSFEYYAANKYVMLAMGKLRAMTDGELAHLELNEPGIIEVFERRGGMPIVARMRRIRATFIDSSAS